MDNTFQEEQEHLTGIYAKICELRDELTAEIEKSAIVAGKDLQTLSDEIRADVADVEADEQMETLAAIETLNAVIDDYNQSRAFDMERLRRVLALLRQPYFAKVRLKMRPGRPSRDVYIGSCGLTDNNHVPLIVDWRSPVAETYYKQENGPTSFTVDGRVRNVELELRRQFDIERDILKMYFDTTIAIEDSLLLKALKQNHTEKLQAITSTIQREQNEVVRHDDCECLLVSGVAGAGKTSVMLQRIAYLLYQERASLKADQVVLISPTDVFTHYIDQVLPSLGEANPRVYTWASFVESLGAGGRDAGAACKMSTLRALEEALPDLSIEGEDIRDIRVSDEVMLTAQQILSCLEKYARFPMGPRRLALARDEMHERLERRISNLARRESYQEELLGLDIEEQVEIFGETIAPDGESEIIALTRTWLAGRFASAHDLIDNLSWLRLDRIGVRVLAGESLDACSWLYLRNLISGDRAKDVRYVMVDEVQDLTCAQLTLLERHFRRAHFLLLGDEFQAIREESASFDEIRDIFAVGHGTVEECDLNVSYRSSPEITELFGSLLPEGRNMLVSSVRDVGKRVRIITCDEDSAAYLSTMRSLIDECSAETELVAIISYDPKRTRWLARELGDVACRLGKHDKLAAHGIYVVDLALAKGLEFDRVIVADAQAYGSDDLSLRRLYTAISRAMHEVTLVSQGKPTSLLDPYLSLHPDALSDGKGVLL